MSVSAEVRQHVRERAAFACEFCGVAEADVAGPLTIDHFQPKIHGGTDDLANLIYCCYLCNPFKADYWPTKPDEPRLWNPRLEPASDHFLLTADGLALPLTPVGDFTVRRLRLNRPHLVQFRLRKQREKTERTLLERYGTMGASLEQLREQVAALMVEHRQLLEEQRALIQLLLMRARKEE